MQVSTTVDDGTLTVNITGELDALSAAQLRPVLEELLARSRHNRLIVDLGALRLIDSSGVGVLVYLFRRLRASGGAFLVRGATEQPLSILRLMKLDRIFMQAPAGFGSLSVH